MKVVLRGEKHLIGQFHPDVGPYPLPASFRGFTLLSAEVLQRNLRTNKAPAQLTSIRCLVLYRYSYDDDPRGKVA